MKTGSNTTKFMRQTKVRNHRWVVFRRQVGSFYSGAETKLSFPFYLDKTGTIKQQLRLAFSPAKVLVDKDGSILKLDATGSFPEEQQEWYRQTSEFISAYLGDERETNNVTIQITVRTLLDLSNLVIQNHRHSRTKASGR